MLATKEIRRRCALMACALVLSLGLCMGTTALADEVPAAPAAAAAQTDAADVQAAAPQAAPEAQAAEAQAASTDAQAAEPQAAPAEDQAAAPQAAQAPAGSVESIVANMTLDEKISQMIIPAIRSWDGVNVTDLSANPELAQALRAHQYGGIILFGQNVSDTEQTARLVSDLQVNNAQIQASTNIPYFTPVDEEGGVVLRLSMGTRMTGNMAVGATGARAVENAQTTGAVLGEECAALGFNLNFAPDVDVNNNPANPVIGTRSFGDDPTQVGKLGAAYSQGLAQSNVIATFKHFPGHGDTGVDSHIGTPSVEKTYDQLKSGELVPFQEVIDAGADMIMTAHITFPLVDDAVVFGDGVTTGYYPATMSKKMITDVLRTDMGFDGVVVTDALEMDAIYKAKLVAGEEGSVEYSANVAEKVINAGVDILLIPTDLKSADAIAFYDDYIAELCRMVEAGTIPASRIDESVTRILELKQKYGILEADTSGANIESVVAAAKQVVGSDEHHAKEAAVAQQAITLVKNENAALPLSGHGSKVVILGRESDDNVLIAHAITQLQQAGVVASDAYVENLSAGTTSGSADSATRITIGHYYDLGEGAIDYSDAAKAAVAQADSVVCFSKMYGLSALQPDGLIYQAVSTVLADAHAAGAKFVLLSGNLPYDAARYPQADAVALAYMSSGIGIDPTERNTPSGTAGAYNANLVAGVQALFDNVAPTGVLPVNIPVMAAGQDGVISYSDEVLYQRGLGLNYTYQFTQGGGATHEAGTQTGLDFATNARFDKLVRVLVDGQEVDAAQYTASWGPTKLSLSAGYLNTLSAATHTLTAVYSYEAGVVNVETTFVTTAAAQPQPAPEPQPQPTPQPTPAPSSAAQPTPAAAPSSAAPAPAASPAKTTAKTADELPAAPLAVLALVSVLVVAASAKRRKETGVWNS